MIRAKLMAVLMLAAAAGCDRSTGPEVPADLPESGAEPVASWNGGRLLRDELIAWAEWQGLEPNAEAAEKLAVLRTLADAAEERGLGSTPRVQLEQDAALQRALLPLLDRHLDTQVVITEDEIETLRLENPGAFQRPRRLLLRGIHKTLPEDPAAAESVRAQMNALRAAVMDGASLPELALRESESQSRFREGSVGFVDPAELPMPLRLAVENLEPDQLSAVVEYDGGIAFYRCEEVREAVLPTPEEVRSKLRQNLFRQRRTELNRELTETLVGAVSIRIDGDPMLTVGDYRLPAAWLDALIAHRLPDRDPADLTRPQIRRLLGEWAHRTSLVQHARSLGLDADPQVRGSLRWGRMNALAAAELRHRVDAGLAAGEPSEEALRSLYRQHARRLNHPAEQRVTIIQFAGPDAMSDPERIDQARRVIGEIDAGNLGFPDAAKQYSIHPSAASGGALGWLDAPRLGSLDVGLPKPIRMPEPGQHTGLLRLPGGLWLARLDERRPSRPMSFEEAREQLEALDRRARITALETEVQQQHRDRIGLQILGPA